MLQVADCEPRLRVVAWNCGGGFGTKRAALASLRADVAIIAEAAASERSEPARANSVPTSSLWAGGDGMKGLLLASFNGWALVPIMVHPDREEILARLVCGSHSLNLLALWPVKRRGGPTYTSIIADAIERHADLLRTGSTIVAGDLNASTSMRGGLGRSFAAIVSRLSEMGLKSAYHFSKGLDHGQEEEPTLFWRRRNSTSDRFHIDFVFAPAEMLSVECASVGSYANWVEPGLSDHVPVIVDLDLTAQRKG